MKRALFVATVTGHILAFHVPYIKMLVDMGYTVDVAANGDEPVPHVANQFNLPFERSPFRLNNIAAYRKLKKLIKSNSYDIIHCHTPVGGIITRLAARGARKKGTNVLYTAHGFHFYKGAPLINWLLYYPAELICSYWTDTLITINQEDYARAKKHFHAARIEYVPGVGIDVDKYANCTVDRVQKRREIGVPDDALLLLSVGELSKRKNHRVVIEALSLLEDKNIHYAIVGRGALEHSLVSLADKLKVSAQVHMLGFRSDIDALCKAADIFCFPSLQEGLPVALMEAMASGLAVVCSDIRGNTDLVSNNVNGFICKANTAEAFAANINRLADPNLRKRMGQLGLISLAPFSSFAVHQRVREIYGFS